MHKLTYIPFIVFGIFTLASLTKPAGAEVTADFYDAVITAEAQVCLGAVAKLSGSPVEIARIKDIPLSVSAGTWRNVVLPSSDLVADVPADVEIRRVGAASVEIHLLVKEGDLVDLTPMLKRRLQAAGGDSILVNLELTETNRTLRVPGELPLCIKILPGAWFNPGNQVITLESCDARDRISRRHLQASLTLTARTATPARLIKRGETIKADDIVIQNIDLKETGLSGVVLCPEQIVGRSAVRHLAPNTIIRWDQVRTPPVLRKGDRIDVVFLYEYVEVKTRALILEDGAKGQNVWVRLENNGKRLRAVVVDQDHVTLQ
ncbi:MAG: flagellar basal body P-ring formation chaperone FlgA [bacterium]|nr:flagellar basal body P-ring formation chaperone FlgA [bacterium]